MRPPRPDIAAPAFPPDLVWLRRPPNARMEALTTAGPVLVHFFDAAQLNGVRTLPYLRSWHCRYREASLTVLGVVSPRLPFSGDQDWLDRELERLGVEHPVALDPSHLMWSDYGCRGWPSLFLWSRGGALRWYHFGEGAYLETERAIQAELREAGTTVALPEPLDPVRPTDDPGAAIARPSDEVFPTGSFGEPLEAREDADTITLGYEAGAAYATIEGAGTARLSLDYGPPRDLAVLDSGLVPLAEHERHERHRLALTLEAGQRLWSISFAPGLADAVRAQAPTGR